MCQTKFTFVLQAKLFHWWFRGGRKNTILSNLCCSFWPNHPRHLFFVFPKLGQYCVCWVWDKSSTQQLHQCHHISGSVLRVSTPPRTELQKVWDFSSSFSWIWWSSCSSSSRVLWFKWKALFWPRFADSSVHFHCSDADALILSAFLLLWCCQPLALICTATQLSLTAVNYCNLL